MRDALVPEIILDQPGVCASVGEGKPHGYFVPCYFSKKAEQAASKASAYTSIALPFR
jgi:hypothetical protein